MSFNGTIIYDGECGFCKKQIDRIKGLDRVSQFQYEVRQSESLLIDFPEMKEFENVDGLRFSSLHHKAYVGADAVYQIYSRLFPFKMIAWCYKIPGLNMIFKRIYKWISDNRQRLSGNCENQKCDIPYQKRN